MTFEKLFVSLDMLAPPIQLNIGGRQSFKTIFGGVLTLLLWSIFLTACGYIVRISLKRDAPISFNEAGTNENYPTFDLKQDNYVPMFMFFINEVDTMTTDMFPKYFTADCMQVTWTASESGSGDYQLLRTLKHFPVVPCKSLPRDKQHYRNYVDRNSTFYSLIEDSGMCVDASDGLSVFGKDSDDVSAELVFRLRPCSLSSGCVGLEELQQVNFFSGLPSANIDLTNYENPYSQTITADELYYINPDLHQMNRLFMRQSEVWDQDSILPDWNRKVSYLELFRTFATNRKRDSLNLNCPVESIGNPDEEPACQTYFQFSFQSSGTTRKIKRRYKTYSETLGEIGGIKELLFMLFAAIYFFPNNQMLKTALVSTVFPELDTQGAKTKIHQVVKQSLDITNISREMQKLKVLSGLLLSPSQTQLISRISLEGTTADRVESAPKGILLSGLRQEVGDELKGLLEVVQAKAQHKDDKNLQTQQVAINQVKVHSVSSPKRIIRRSLQVPTLNIRSLEHGPKNGLIITQEISGQNEHSTRSTVKQKISKFAPRHFGIFIPE